MYIHRSSQQQEFQPAPFDIPFWLRNPHIQTILPKFLAKKPPKYRRELYKDSFNTSDVAYDFYDADTEKAISVEDGRILTPLVVLFHGLEGSSNSHYAKTLAHQVHAMNWHYVVPHYRSCGGVSAQSTVFYNAGDSVEIHYVLGYLSQYYAKIYAVGVSLGGNMLAKYMGEQQEDALCHAAVVISAPLDLTSSSVIMKQGLGKYIYTPHLLTPLVTKALATQLSQEEITAIKASKNFYDFDHVFTAPRHGFCSVNDYYHQCAALPVLNAICKPTLIITAKDDPFLGVTATECDVSSAVTLIKTKYGGHIGFLRYITDDNQGLYMNRKKRRHRGRFNTTWFADTTLDFLNWQGLPK